MMFLLERRLNYPILDYIGWIIWGFSIFFAFIPFFSFKRRGGVKKGKSYLHTTRMVTHGVYAIVRHPQYLGGMLFSISIALWNPEWLNIIFTSIILLLTYQWTYSEDKKLVEKFGKVYDIYKKKVPRLNPLLGLIKHFNRRND